MSTEVKLSPFAARQIEAIRDEGEAKPTKTQGKRWAAIERMLREYLPEHALNPKHRKRGEFVNIRATHVGRRDRLVWIASEDGRVAVVLMLGFVKDGDHGDTYPELLRELKRGTFDTQFAELALAGGSGSEPQHVKMMMGADDEVGAPESVASDG